jgi:hypothetical protein
VQLESISLFNIKFYSFKILFLIIRPFGSRRYRTNRFFAHDRQNKKAPDTVPWLFSREIQAFDSLNKAWVIPGGTRKLLFVAMKCIIPRDPAADQSLGD